VPDRGCMGEPEVGSPYQLVLERPELATPLS
jgi:hypothetical protein